MSKFSKQRIKDLILNGTKSMTKTINGKTYEWVGIGWIEIKTKKLKKEKSK